MHRLASNPVPIPQSGVTDSLRHALGFACSSPFPFAAGPTSLRLRRQREERARQRRLAAAERARLPRRESASAV